MPQLLTLLKCVCFSFSFPFKAWALYQCTFLSCGGSSGRILEILPYDNPLCFGKYCCCKSNRICSNLLLKNRSRCHLCDKPWLQASVIKPRKPAFWMPFGMADSRAATYSVLIDMSAFPLYNWSSWWLLSSLPDALPVKLFLFEREMLQNLVSTQDRIHMDAGLRQKNRFSLLIIPRKNEIKRF